MSSRKRVPATATAPYVAERMRWAVETLDVQPGGRVLEIGCGSGGAAALVCDWLVRGEMLAIDRSPIQIERARRRNDAHLAAGRLSLRTVELADLDAGDARFDCAGGGRRGSASARARRGASHTLRRRRRR
jgi:protein-L-isoaspartate O-methyltransferase